MLHCTNCGRALDDVEPGESSVRCVSCGARLEIQAFPALVRPARVVAPQTVADASDAACFVHRDKQAVASCAKCGRFLCSLCEVRMGEAIWCFDCFASRGAQESDSELQARATLHDSLALSLAIFSMLFVWPTLLTAPIVLFLSVRYWSRGQTLLPRSKVRFVAAAGLASVQLLGWAALAIALLATVRSGR